MRKQVEDDRENKPEKQVGNRIESYLPLSIDIYVREKKLFGVAE